MPRVLIAGCGYLGQAIAELLLAEGWEIEGWTKSANSAREFSGKSYPVRAVDISKEDQVLAAKSDFDAVIHCASTRGGEVDLYRQVYLDGARNLLNQFRNAKFLFVSSTSVYAQIGGEQVTEQSPAQPTRETGKILRAAEKLVLERGGLVVRLGGIYGPGRSALLRRFIEGTAALDPQPSRFVNQIHRDDAAAAIRLLLMHEELAGEIYNVVDDEPILLNDCYRWLATKLKRPISSSAESAPRKRGESNKRVSNAKLRAIGWAPRYRAFAEGMERSVLPSFVRDAI
jgi:nucleoside-diphosphate-sugar epimerase